MHKTMQDYVAEAKATTGVVAPADAHAADGVILDVRETGELAESGEVAGAVHVPRGFLEARADPSAESAHPPLTRAHGGGMPVHVLCASGARAALAARTLTEMGYDAKPIEGGLKAWCDHGLPLKD
ncbi:rhodanese-like domain-containing protein [Aurantimonas sp. A2-1-M11]|uniref:rhodanese-like domain-containing protein n=1 Tax=Aurantimonas sp. A2-1-M11 TaxID=3113712 RepID=UPI002F94F164